MELCEALSNDEENLVLNASLCGNKYNDGKSRQFEYSKGLANALAPQNAKQPIKNKDNFNFITNSNFDLFEQNLN